MMASSATTKRRDSHLIPPGLVRLPRPTWQDVEGGYLADELPAASNGAIFGDADPLTLDKMREAMDRLCPPPPIVPRPLDWSIKLRPEKLLDEPPLDPLREFFRIRIYVSSAVPKDKIYAITPRWGMPQLHASASVADAIVAAGVNCVVIDNRPWAEQEHERIWRDVRRDIARECPTIAPAWWGRS